MAISAATNTRTILHTIGHALPISISIEQACRSRVCRQLEKMKIIEKLSRNVKLSERWHGACPPYHRAHDLVNRT
jgi:hypothetical protein